MPLISVDYSQLEYKIAATVWPDPKFTEAAASGDAHAGVARQMFGAECDGPRKKEIRVLAKNINFGTLYGSEGFAVAEQTGLPLKEIEGFIEIFHNTFPGLFAHMEATKQLAVDPGYVTTLTGRTRHFYLKVSGWWEGSAEYKKELREALNTVVQGPAAHLTMFAQILLSRWLRTRGLRAILINNVHDALMLDAPTEEIPLVVDQLCVIMRDLPTTQAPWWEPFELAVPLVAKPDVGPTWGEMMPYAAWQTGISYQEWLEQEK